MTNWNAIAVEKKNKVSRLVQSLGFPPVKFINPSPIKGWCQVYVSNYGGGLVDGDCIQLNIECHSESQLYLGTQSSNKIYKGKGKGGSSQVIKGFVHANAMAVICPDPLVPFAQSEFGQSQTWQVHPDGELMLFDWLQPGRVSRGEVFSFEKFSSELRIVRPDGTLIFLDKLSMQPKSESPFRCGYFGSFQSLLTVYCLGPRMNQWAMEMESEILALNFKSQELRTAEIKHGKVNANSPGLWVGMGKREDAGYLIRAVGGEKSDIQPLHDLIFSKLSKTPWMGFNPWDRRW